MWLSDVATSGCRASLEPISSPITCWDEVLTDSKLLLSEKELSLSFDFWLMHTISEVAAEIPSAVVNLFSATTGRAYCLVSKPEGVSLTDFSSLEPEGADGTDVEVPSFALDLAFG